VGGGGAGSSKNRRQPTRLLLTFLVVLLGSGMLIASSVYTWSMHEDKSRLAKANRHLAHQLQEAEDELKRLQELNSNLSSGAGTPLSDAPPVPLPPAPPGPEPQERDTRIIQRNSPEEAELRSRAGLGPADFGGVGLSREGWTADNPDIAGVLERGSTGTLWYVGRDEAWYIIDRTSHQRLLHAASLFVGSEGGKRSAAGEAAARLAQAASADAVNTLDHLARSLHALAAAHAQGLGVPDEPMLGAVRDVLVRLVCNPLVRRVCSTRYGIGISAAAVLVSNPDAQLSVFDDSRAPYTSVTQVPAPPLPLPSPLSPASRPPFDLARGARGQNTEHRCTGKHIQPR
jgi:type II secretory pathway pseudopilin PulG